MQRGGKEGDRIFGALQKVTGIFLPACFRPSKAQTSVGSSVQRIDGWDKFNEMNSTT
jgi:hypothetical protein